MTGFGRGESSADERSWIVEIRTVNHRFLDQKVVMPRAFAGLEERIKKIVASRQDRGRVDVTVSLKGKSSSTPLLTVDMELARQYHDCMQQLADEFGLSSRIQLSELLGQRDIISLQEQSPDIDVEWPLVRQAVIMALDECAAMREQEGQSLKEDLLSRLESFASIVQEIETSIPEVLAQRQKELVKRIGKLLAGMDIDPMRLAQETAVMADKADVTEEVVRLASHIAQFRAFLNSNEPVGRRLDFLLQEFLREVNTLASKISNAAIAHLGVEMKNEIEKLREQVQNIE
jgi:uncharacterized protein (TIGR00255 family)